LSVDSKNTIVFISSSVKTEFYLATGTATRSIDFLEAVEYLKAEPEEQALPFDKNSGHYKHVNDALDLFAKEYIEAADTTSINRGDLDKSSLEAKKFLRIVKQHINDDELKTQCDILTTYINEGIYSQLPRNIKNTARTYKNEVAKIIADEHNIKKTINELYNQYQTHNKEQHHETNHITDPQIIISETFI